jgi:hypothetical protein
MVEGKREKKGGDELQGSSPYPSVIFEEEESKNSKWPSLLVRIAFDQKQQEPAKWHFE